MIINQNRRMALEYAQNVLANDYACQPDVFVKDGVTVNEFGLRPGGRGFGASFQAITFGRGTVIACESRFMEPVSKLASALERDDFFYPAGMGPLFALLDAHGVGLRGPSLKHIVTCDQFQPAYSEEGEINLLETEGVLALAHTPGFPNALDRSPTPNPVALKGAVVWRDGQLIAAAAASEDAPHFWQIGVDVLPEAQGKGLGSAVVSRLTETILDLGDLPYYSAAGSNIASRSIAQRLGFWPAFTEIHARPYAP